MVLSRQVLDHPDSFQVHVVLACSIDDWPPLIFVLFNKMFILVLWMYAFDIYSLQFIEINDDLRN